MNTKENLIKLFWFTCKAIIVAIVAYFFIYNMPDIQINNTVPHTISLNGSVDTE
jgi:hypothetical protein